MRGGVYGNRDRLKRMLLSFDLSQKRNRQYVTILLYGSPERQGLIFIAIRTGKEYTQKMKMDERVYREMFTELEGYEKRGVDISIDGYRASPLEIITAHMTREEGTYMRDYVLGREGNIEALRFTDIHSYGQEQSTPLNV